MLENHELLIFFGQVVLNYIVIPVFVLLWICVFFGPERCTQKLLKATVAVGVVGIQLYLFVALAKLNNPPVAVSALELCLRSGRECFSGPRPGEEEAMQALCREGGEWGSSCGGTEDVEEAE